MEICYSFIGLECSGIIIEPSWDIPFQLNRNYGLTAMNSDLNFPMDITTPSDGLLYSVPAQTLFSDKRFPEEPLYMQLNFQPNSALTEFFFLTIRDPDGILRFSLSMYKVTSACVHAFIKVVFKCLPKNMVKLMNTVWLMWLINMYAKNKCNLNMKVQPI